MKQYIIAIFLVVLACTNVCAEEIVWTTLQKGIEIATIDVEQKDKQVILVRVTPTYYHFSILSAKLLEHKPLPIAHWMEQHEFIVAINASMYARDDTTSVGYLRNRVGINNEDFSKSFGAIFFARPLGKRYANATIIDQTERPRSEIKKYLEQYAEVVQNYRMISETGEVVWQAYSTTPTTISAVGIDDKKRILFIHSEALLTQTMLATMLAKLPLGIRTTMYTEGGKEAVLVVNTKKMQKIWLGQSRNPFSSPSSIPLPNLIGVFSQ